MEDIRSTRNKRLASNMYLAMRWAFGAVWSVDAALKYEPAFYHGVLNMIKGADAGGPGWLNPWFHLWYQIIGMAPGIWAIVIIAVETAIALSLLLGLARRYTYVAGAAFSFLIWGVAEGFGGPYVAGSTDVGAGIIYALLFVSLLALDTVAEPRYCLDTLIAPNLRRWWQVSGAKTWKLAWGRS